MGRSPSVNPTPPCSRLWSVLPARKGSESSDSTDRTLGIRPPLPHSHLSLCLLRGNDRDALSKKRPSCLEDRNDGLAKPRFANQLGDDANASVAISSGLLDVEREELISEKGMRLKGCPRWYVVYLFHCRLSKFRRPGAKGRRFQIYISFDKHTPAWCMAPPPVPLPNRNHPKPAVMRGRTKCTRGQDP